MKQIRDFATILGISILSTISLNAQYGCSTAEYIVSLPFSASDLFTSAVQIPNVSQFCDQNATDFGNYYIFQYSPEVEENITVEISSSNVDLGIYLYSSCQNPLTQCVNYLEGNEEITFSFIAEGGVDYSIFVGTVDSEQFDIVIYKEVVLGVAINKPEPTQTFDVNGAIRIGENLTTPYKGTLKWSNFSNDLQGFNGAEWESVKTRKLDELHEAIYDYSLGSIYIGKGAGSENINPPVSNSYNTVAVGDSSLHHNGSGATLGFHGGQNVALGAKAGFENTSGFGNAYIGYQSGFSNESGHSNVALGKHALFSSVEQSNLVAIGDSALHFNGNTITVTPTGIRNTAVGSKAGLLNTIGSSNSFVGFESGRNNVTGNRNTFLGAESGFKNLNGVDNTFVGSQAGYSNLSGNENTFIGVQSGVLNAGGNSNTFQGYFSGNRNTSGSENTFIGHSAGRNNTTGDANLFIGSDAGLSNNVGFSNLFIGQSAGKSGTTASYNLAIGSEALSSNTDKTGNIAIGDSSLYSAAGNSVHGGAIYNTAVGFHSGRNSTTGDHNAFFGSFAGFANAVGRNNSYFGFEAGRRGAEAENNTFMGTYAGDECLNGDNNTILGYGSGSALVIGDENTYVGSASAIRLRGSENVSIGYLSGAAGTATVSYDNSIALGARAKISGSNQARIGNSSTASIGGYTAWSNLSDGRYKFNIKEESPGLEFILGLRPVSYQIDFDKLSRKEYANKREVPLHVLQSAKSRSGELKSGFIAQEVEQLVIKQDAAFDGVVIPKNEDANYALSYSTFVVPLVKAVQEQQEMIAELKNQNENLNSKNQDLLNRLEKIEKQINLLVSTSQNEN